MSTSPAVDRPQARKRTRELRHQPSFPGLCPIAEAVEKLATTGGIEARGAIFTRREVVEFLLDLALYTPDQPLHTLRFLEPSFGGGDFLLPAIERLLAAWKASDDGRNAREALADCIRAVELHRQTFAETKTRVIDLLTGSGLGREEAVGLAEVWLINGDFLLAEFPGAFDTVVGNPPYVRQELIPDILLAEYRDRYTTIFDRADLYIPFIERSLMALAEGGVLGFICADRWMKNRYGGPLRRLVSEQFHLKAYVDMVDTPAFHSRVIAYPAITVIARERGKTTRIAHQPPVERQALRDLSRVLLSRSAPPKGIGVQTIDGVTCGSEPWILDSSDQLDVIRGLEATFRILEQTPERDARSG